MLCSLTNQMAQRVEQKGFEARGGVFEPVFDGNCEETSELIIINFVPCFKITKHSAIFNRLQLGLEYVTQYRPPYQTQVKL